MVDEIGGQGGQSIVLAFRPAVFDRQILSLDVAGLAQSLAECGHIRCKLARRGAGGAEIADHRHRLLLRTRRDRPGHRRATEECYELAPPQGETASARLLLLLHGLPRSAIMRRDPST